MSPGGSQASAGEGLRHCTVELCSLQAGLVASKTDICSMLCAALKDRSQAPITRLGRLAREQKALCYFVDPVCMVRSVSINFESDPDLPKLQWVRQTPINCLNSVQHFTPVLHSIPAWPVVWRVVV